MNNASRYLRLPVMLLATLAIAAGCNAISNITNTLANLKNLRYKVDGIRDVRMAGVSLTGKRSVSDFSIADAARLTAAFAKNEFPLDLTVNVAVQNPNTGSQGTKNIPVQLTRLEWRLLIDNKETVSGVVSNPLTVPASGETVYVPVTTTLDMKKFFADKGYADIANLALAIAGAPNTTRNVSVDALPTISTSLTGEVRSPSRIVIVEKEFRQ